MSKNKQDTEDTTRLFYPYRGDEPRAGDLADFTALYQRTKRK